MNNGSGKSIQEILHAMKNEVIDFFATRAEMLSSEMSEKARTWKMAAPSLMIGCLLLLTAWLLLTTCLVALVAMAFNPPWNYASALAIVSAGYLLIGGLIAWMGWKALRDTSLTPERTIRTLKQDRIWLESEVETQL